MWKPTNIFISFLLVIDSFFVSYAVGLNSRHVLVEEPGAQSAVAKREQVVAASPASAVTITPLSKPVVATATSAFIDLTKTESRLQTSLNRAAAAGMLDPTEDRMFRPNDPVTRADFTRWMVRIRQVPQLPAEKPTYRDVPETDPYYKEIEGATKSMLVQGYNQKGKALKDFKPNQFITRQEFAVMYGTFSGKRSRAEKLSQEETDRYLRYDATDSDFGNKTYIDVGDVDDWARKWVAVAQQAGVLAQSFAVDPFGAEEEKRYFRPQQKMTRGEAVNILVKLYGTKELTETVTEQRATTK
jgi:hypothetical protein